MSDLNPDDVLDNVADAITEKVRAGYDANAFVGMQIHSIDWNYGDWDDELKQLCTRVDVIPVTFEETSLATRTSDYFLCRCDLAIRCKFDPQLRTQAGPIHRKYVARLIHFMQELYQFLRPNPQSDDADVASGRLPNYRDAVWQESKVLFTFQRERLRTQGMFFGAMSVKYGVRKSIT
ncbi:hypothetical protein [Anatilimnocola floriformis]|uniref:hypothetical protein n=1 Tax=Anatilimnocola floriformis TaxID=2948575 RepID=UPI0020C5152A|nr:hypothetical protein [Anatilimnocola floriformis]